MAIEGFEDLECWRFTRILVHEVLSHTSTGRFDHFKSLKWQLQSAALSVMRNIAEGFDRFHPKERLLFLNYSAGSCGEVRSMLYVCLDLGIISTDDFESLVDRVRSTQRLTVGLIRHIRNSR